MAESKRNHSDKSLVYRILSIPCARGQSNNFAWSRACHRKALGGLWIATRLRLVGHFRKAPRDGARGAERIVLISRRRPVYRLGITDPKECFHAVDIRAPGDGCSTFRTNLCVDFPPKYFVHRTRTRLFGNKCTPRFV